MPPGIALSGGRERQVRFGPGAPGAGDPYFPKDGNGGYNVRHYLLDLRYDPATDRLTGIATIRSRATQALSRFNLDLDGLKVRSVRVNGHPAAWTRRAGELRVTPQSGLRRTHGFTTVIHYQGVPGSSGAQLGQSGFIHTDDGALIAGQPHVATQCFQQTTTPATRQPSPSA